MYAMIFSLLSHEQIRSSMFTLASAVCEQTPQFAAENVKILCSTILGSLAEDDPIVIGPLWEACLLLITKIEVCCPLTTKFFHPNSRSLKDWTKILLSI